MKAFEKRLCIGERHVNVDNLLERSAAFALIFYQGSMQQICDFLEQTGFCPHLIRTFYLCAGNLKDDVDGPLEFKTVVHNVSLMVTPHTVAAALGMEANVVDMPYTQGHSLSNLNWCVVDDGVCLPNTRSAAILSIQRS